MGWRWELQNYEMPAATTKNADSTSYDLVANTVRASFHTLLREPPLADAFACVAGIGKTEIARR
jgi:hypothetical protein